MTNTKNDRPIIIGIDAEYEADPTNTKKNTFLSFQWSVLPPNGTTCNGIVHSYDGKRLEFARWIEAALRDAKAKGVIKKWPKELVVAAHFSAAEFTMWADRQQLARDLLVVHGTFVTGKRPLKLKVRDAAKHVRKTKVHLVDTTLLAPAGQKRLEDVGKVFGLEKIDLPDGYIEKMSKLREDNPVLFDRYAIRDAEIAARYAAKLFDFASENGLLQQGKMPPTIGGYAVGGVLNHLARQGIAPEDFIGYTTKYVQGKRDRVPTYPTSALMFDFAAPFSRNGSTLHGYMGGRNEAFVFGAHNIGPFTDFDLRAAYSTALASIRYPDWQHAHSTQNLEDFASGALGVAHIRFKHSPNTRFPVFAVDTGSRGLVFPMEGETMAWAPEIAVARALGCEVEIIDGWIVPWKDDSRPFAEFAREMNQKRDDAKARGDEFSNKLFKEMVNSAYGKTGQGLKQKKAYRANTGDMELIAPSAITNAFFAGHTTAFVRAVLAEILNQLPPSRIVCNVITDGFLTNATNAEVAAACQGPLATMFAECRRLIGGAEAEIYEAKGRAAGVVVCRTRQHFAIDGDIADTDAREEDGSDALGSLEDSELDPEGCSDPEYDNQIAATVGIKFDESEFAGVSDEDRKAHKAKLAVELWVNRTKGQKTEIPGLIKGRKLLTDPGQDVCREKREVKLRMEFDFKRRPANVYTGVIEGRELLAFDTAPWQRVEEFMEFRDAIEKQDYILKTPQDLDDLFKARRVHSIGGTRGVRRKPGEGVKATSRRAIVRAAAGAMKSMPPRILAERLKANGIETSPREVSQARKDLKAGKVKPALLPVAAISAADMVHRTENAFEGTGAILFAVPDEAAAFQATRAGLDEMAASLGAKRGEPVAGAVEAYPTEGPFRGLARVFYAGGAPIYVVPEPAANGGVAQVADAKKPNNYGHK